MIEHLTAEQISQWMLGERTPPLREHVAECARCRAELEQLESTLVQFRGVVREWSNSVTPPAWQLAERRTPWISWPRIAMVSATLMMLVAGPYYWQTLEHERAAVAAADAAKSDAQLLERVDSSLSRSVPEPMEPLLTLATWNSNGEEKTQVKTQ